MGEFFASLSHRAKSAFQWVLFWATWIVIYVYGWGVAIFDPSQRDKVLPVFFVLGAIVITLMLGIVAASMTGVDLKPPEPLGALLSTP